MLSPHSVKPYYKEKYALVVKPIVDQLAASKDRLVLKFNRYPTYKPATLRLLVFQGWEYLIDKMEYPRDQRRMWMIRTRGDGLEFEPQAGTPSTFGPKLAAKEPLPIDDDWFDKMESFLDNATPGEMFEIGVRLNEDTRANLERNLQMLDGSMWESKVELDRLWVRRKP